MNEEVQTETADNGFPADEFVQAREAQGLSVEQVCRQLHLTRTVVEAIEKGDLQRLSDPVFSRGYIRSYAKLLKLDADYCVACYNRASGNLQTAATVRSIGSVSTVPGRHRGRPLLKIGSWLFVIALIAVIIWWWQTQQGLNPPERDDLGSKPLSIETSDGKTLVLSPPGDGSTVGTQPAAADGKEMTETEDAGTLPLSPRSDSTDRQRSEPGENETPEAAARSATPEEIQPAAIDTLDIAFTDDCWISIREIGGRTLFNGVASAGQVLSFQSEARLSVVVGKVSAISRFSYEGQAVDLASMSKDDVARLTLPL